MRKPASSHKPTQAIGRRQPRQRALRAESDAGAIVTAEIGLRLSQPRLSRPGANSITAIE